MKNKLQLFLLLCALLSLFACGHKPYPHSLSAADSLSNVNADSAIAVLNSLKVEMESAPEATQMYYRFLCIKANDKAYIDHTSDSLILPILHYYIEKNDERHLPEAYYYAGRVYRDLGVTQIGFGVGYATSKAGYSAEVCAEVGLAQSTLWGSAGDPAGTKMEFGSDI